MLERFKKDPVLFISGILAIVSCFIVHPDMEYIGYVDFRVLAILFCMMLVVSEPLMILNRLRLTRLNPPRRIPVRR